MSVILSKQMVLPSKLQFVYEAGDMALQYGKFVSSGKYNDYTMTSSRMVISHMESVYDDGYGEYVDENVENLVAIEVNAKGFRKLIIDATVANAKYGGNSFVGWALSPTYSNTTPSAKSSLTQEHNEYVFDIAGNDTIYIWLFSWEYATYVYNIRLE